MGRHLSAVLCLCLAGYVSAQGGNSQVPVAAVPVSAPAVTAATSAILPEATNVTTGILLPNPPAPTCAVGITASLTNGSFAVRSNDQPSAYPVPSVVLGNLSLALTNLNVTNLETYNVTLEVPYGVIIANLTFGSPGLPRAGPNNTVAIDIVVNSTLAAAATNINTMNMSMVAGSQDFVPRRITVNGTPCALGLTPNVTVVPEEFSQAANDTPNLSSFAVAGAVGTNGTQLVGVDGLPLTLRGVNWFGFETQANMVDGLFYDETLRGDFATVAYRIQLLGFNAIRIPFSFLVLFQQTPTIYTRPCTISSEADIRANVIDPRDAPNIPANAEPPSIVDPPSTYGTSGVCNDYVPNNSVFTRFLYVIGYLARQGFYILIDNHANTDPTVVTNPDVMTSINQDPVAASRVMVDVLNEPDSRSLTWNEMSSLYLRAMDAIYQVNPNTLFFIEGVGPQYPIQMCWGDGFVTDPAVLAQYNLPSPRPFFDQALTRPYLNNIVISPHYYGPTISLNADRYSGTDLAYRASTSWGYLNREGYGGHQFPIVIGETGSYFVDPRDLAFYRDLELYLNNESYMNDGRHNPVQNLFWWSWNANSGDTGGIVDSDNWLNVLWPKVEYLESAIGLTPWSLIASGAATPTPTTTPAPTSPANTVTPAPTVTAAPTPTTTSAPTTPAPTTTSAPTTPAPTTPATPTPSTPSTTSSPSTPGPTSCAVAYSVGNSWSNNGQEFYVLNFGLSNSGTTPITTPYAITASNPRYQGILATWNWQASVANGVISGTSDPNASWETLEPNRGNSPTVGLIVQVPSDTTNTNVVPNQVSINGSPCALTAA